WFRAADFPHNLRQVWDTHWGNLQQQGVPLLLGEFSARSVGNDYEGIWQRSLMSYLGERGIGAIYWAWNPDSADTDGMLQEDWTTINQPELDAMMGRQPSVSKSGSASPGLHQSGQVCHQPARPDAHIDGCTCRRTSGSESAASMTRSLAALTSGIGTDADIDRCRLHQCDRTLIPADG